MIDADLTGKVIAVSLTPSPDLARLNLTMTELRQAGVAVASHLLHQGATLAFPGDLRRTMAEPLLDLAATWCGTDGRPRIRDYLAGPTHATMDADDLAEWRELFADRGELVLLDPPKGEIDEAAWMIGLTEMRRRVTADADAWVMFGGSVRDSHGRWPAVAEQTWLGLEAGKPVFLAGGFGGCTRDVLRALDIDPDYDRDWTGRDPEAVHPGYAAAMAALENREPNDRLTRQNRRRLASATDSNAILDGILQGLCQPL